MKVINDYKIYLDEIDRLSKNLSLKQKKELENILKVNLTMLVALKKSSKLGCVLSKTFIRSLK